jgi:hypothetical protein
MNEKEEKKKRGRGDKDYKKLNHQDQSSGIR